MKLTAGLALLLVLLPVAAEAQRTAGKQDSLKDAAASPLYDLNVLKTKIPPALIQAEAAPYRLPQPLTCVTVMNEIMPLDEALGPDLDIPPSLENPSALERSNEMAKDGSVSLVRSGAQSLVPFRGPLRILTGAERNDQIVRQSIVAGGVRRAFLKGLGHMLRCPEPARPGQQSLAGIDLDPPKPKMQMPQLVRRPAGEPPPAPPPPPTR